MTCCWNCTAVDFRSDFTDVELSFLVHHVSMDSFWIEPNGIYFYLHGCPGQVFQERFLCRWNTLKLRCSTNIAGDFRTIYSYHHQSVMNILNARNTRCYQHFHLCQLRSFPADKFQLPVPSPDKGGGLASGAARLSNPWQINYVVQ